MSSLYKVTKVFDPPVSISNKEVVNIVMTDFTDHKLEGDEWKSEPFYSHGNGYKFILLVYANGKYSGRGNSVSVYMHLMKGEHDSNLSFPFRGELLLQLLDVRGGDTHEESIKYNEETDSSSKYGGRVRLFSRSMSGFGCNEFIRHNHLRFNEATTTQYLSDDDALQFRIVFKHVLNSSCY